MASSSRSSGVHPTDLCLSPIPWKRMGVWFRPATLTSLGYSSNLYASAKNPWQRYYGSFFGGYYMNLTHRPYGGVGMRETHQNSEDYSDEPSLHLICCASFQSLMRGVVNFVGDIAMFPMKPIRMIISLLLKCLCCVRKVCHEGSIILKDTLYSGLQAVATDFCIDHPDFSLLVRYLSGSVNPFHIFDLMILVKMKNSSVLDEFKFDPSLGFSSLYEEICYRLRLTKWTFRLEYVNWEAIWIVLNDEHDLICCLRSLEQRGSRCLLIRIREGSPLKKRF